MGHDSQTKSPSLLFKHVWKINFESIKNSEDEIRFSNTSLTNEIKTFLPAASELILAFSAPKKQGFLGRRSCFLGAGAETPSSPGLHASLHRHTAFPHPCAEGDSSWTTDRVSKVLCMITPPWIMQVFYRKPYFFFFLHVQFSQCQLLKRLSFSYCIFLNPLS